MTVRLANATRNAILEVLNTALGGATLRIYSGPQPQSVGTSASGVMLAELTFATPAGVATGGVLTFNPFTADSFANANGTAGWARAVGVGGINAIADFSVSAAAGAGELKVDNIEVKAGAVVSVTSFTVTAPAP